MDFLAGKNKTPKFSVNDDLFAVLENSVVELESRLYWNVRIPAKQQTQCRFHYRCITSAKTPLAALKLYCEMDQARNLGAHSQKQLALIRRMEHLILACCAWKLRADVYELQFAKHDLSRLWNRSGKN